MNPHAHPHSLDAEKAVLGSILVDPGQLPAVGAVLSDVDFYLEKHRKIFGCMRRLEELGEPIDVITIANKFADATDIGGVTYLSVVSDGAPMSVNAVHYADIVARLARQRYALHTTRSWMERIAESSDPDADIHAMGKALTVLADRVPARQGRPIHEIASAAYDSAHAYVYGGQVGWSTGYEAFDEAIDCLQPKRVYYVYARSKMGKTAWAANVGGHLVWADDPVPVFIWTGEMDAERYLRRICVARAKVDLRSLKRGYGPGKMPLHPDDIDRDFRRYGTMLGEASSMPHLKIIDDRGLTPAQLRTQAAAHFGEHGPGVIIADYIQKMRPNKPSGSREQDVASISTDLVAIAHQEECALIGLGQLNRGAKNRSDKRPQQDDIRESDGPLFDADVFAFLHRPVYFEARKLGRRESELPAHREAELIITANRSGEAAMIPLKWFGEHQRFETAVDGWGG